MVGETLGSYRILKQLGSGAMGQVYLAEHRHLKRQAALKLLARELVDRPDLLERFFNEARATSAIAHPGIVQIFDCEIDANGRPYIVMELLTGETLAGLLARQGALPPLVVARLMRSLAEALEAAHAKGIVHRDLKPENMFVQATPPDSVKVVDFGIAKLAGDLQAGQVHRTRSGAVMGTPLYMSPEQCRDSAALDFRTDLYSLGCVMYEMLTGRPPFSRDNFGELMVAHLTQPAPDARTANPAIPAPLAELTAELLCKDPTQRPASMRAVADRLMTYVARMTTAPGAAASAPTGLGPSSAPASVSIPHAAGGGPSAEAGVVRTTFGASASEVTAPRDSGSPSPRRTVMVSAAVALVAGVAVAGSFLLKRGPETAPVSASAAPPAAAAAATALPATTPPAPGPSPASPAAASPVAGARAAVTKRAEETTAPQAAETKSKRGAHHAGPVAGARLADAPAAPVAEAAAPLNLAGTWEGPWSDHAHDQLGRLYLQVGQNGSVAGWMYNTSAKQSYRMSGTFTPAGALELTCQCPPGRQFVARGGVHAAADGELKGELSLASASGVFGQQRVTLHSSTAAR
jgi:serine/threonine protein kinase